MIVLPDAPTKRSIGPQWIMLFNTLEVCYIQRNQITHRWSLKCIWTDKCCRRSVWKIWFVWRVSRLANGQDPELLGPLRGHELVDPTFLVDIWELKMIRNCSKKWLSTNRGVELMFCGSDSEACGSTSWFWNDTYSYYQHTDYSAKLRHWSPHVIDHVRYRLSSVWRFGLNSGALPLKLEALVLTWATFHPQPLKDSGVTTMRFPSVLYLFPSIVPQPQSPPTPAGNVESFAGLLSPASVALGLPQLTSDPVLTRFPAQAVSSASEFDTSALPRSAVSSALDLPNGVTPGTFHLRDAALDPSGVCQGLEEDLDITGLGERQQPRIVQISFYNEFTGVRIMFYVTSLLTGRTPEPHHILSELLG